MALMENLLTGKKIGSDPINGSSNLSSPTIGNVYGGIGVVALHTDLWHREYRIETDMSPLVEQRISRLLTNQYNMISIQYCQNGETG